ncbi:hypothetical protein RV11_GL001800 [Enterococcus phoeniculicola]|jgi:uncharacterized membrane protein YesL|uniref:Integral membrane protein n=1 Tax=Enterococcus phoeniculicola ATCC BAA-412 TaxID=1158610 RepID=R3TJ91_9ENTE|nr:DUF624 domain-containing protein [Enterococcus phoeniculicola]EOL41173.1 hypothetical protein UC3_03504 [Enterococcus phoeniculicola ATCC BAA-412]EOT78568.1 hypothetical protein I589_00073 [Enterococcus phoeniculicola ATCC BAA-412]OJG69990.1 hypothetical protein RV11_GL001800 [Enterococcus phoeniculicola]
MSKIFSTEGKIYSGMERIYQILLLNSIFIISCLPVVTIGAALASAYGTAYKMIDHSEGVLYKEYLRQLKLNMLPATKLWVLILAVIGAGFWTFPYVQSFMVGNKIAYYLTMVFITFLVLMSLYLFPLIARFDNSLSGTVVNAMILSLKHLPQSIIVFFITIGGVVIVPIYLPKLLFVWLFTGIGTVIFINANILMNVFKKYDITEERS